MGVVSQSLVLWSPILFSSSGCAELKEYEKKSVVQIVPMSVTSDELVGIYNVLGMVHAADDSAEELKETVRVSATVPLCTYVGTSYCVECDD